MYFNTKNYLKNTHNHTTKHAINHQPNKYNNNNKNKYFITKLNNMLKTI
jgi:hypothetical protein